MTTRDWQRARTPVQPDEVTEAMLAPARKAAGESWLPQTVWPSRWYGRDFHGVNCLLASAAFVIDRPVDAAPGASPLLTVLPARYHRR